MTVKKGMSPAHPGEILREEMEALDLSANALSTALKVPVNRMTLTINGQRGVSADSALRLSRFFATTPNLGINLQNTWELRQAKIDQDAKIAEQAMPLKSAV